MLIYKLTIGNTSAFFYSRELARKYLNKYKEYIFFRGFCTVTVDEIDKFEFSIGYEEKIVTAFIESIRMELPDPSWIWAEQPNKDESEFFIKRVPIKGAK